MHASQRKQTHRGTVAITLVLICWVAGPMRASRAATACEIPRLTWEYTEANNPLLAPGTKISFSSQCVGASEAPFKVQVRDGGGSRLFLLEGMAAGSGDLKSVSDIYIPVQGAEVCVNVGGTQVCKRFTLGSGADTNTPPRASFSDSCTELTCTFTDTSTDADPGGAIAHRAWDLDGNGTVDSKEADPTFTYPSAGTYEVRLTVTDDQGSTTSSVRSITVNSAPVASFDVVCDVLTCSFSDTSTDPGGRVAGWAWDIQGDGSIDYEANAFTHAYAAAGTYDVVLTVTDDAQATSSVTRSITVYGPLAIDTSSLPGATKKVPYSVRLQASGGKPAYSWSLLSGSLPPGLVLASDGALSGTPKNPGKYTFTLGLADRQEPQRTASRAFTIAVAGR